MKASAIFPGAIHLENTYVLNSILLPWLVWLSGLSAGLQTEGRWFNSQSRAHAWVAGQVSSGELVGGNYTLMFLSLTFSPSLPLSLKINK